MTQQDNKKLDKKTKSPNKSPSKYLQFTSVAFQMGGTIFLGNYLGKCLDSTYNKDFWESTITLLSIFIAIYLVIAQVIKVSKQDD